MWLDMSQRVFALIFNFLLPKSGEQLSEYSTVPLDISSLYNNRAASFNGTGPANFNRWGGTFPAHLLPTRSFDYDGIRYHLPKEWGHENDNVVAEGQVFELPKPASVNELHVLFAGDWQDGETGDRFTFEFEDGSTQEVEMTTKNWWAQHFLNVPAIRIPYHFEGTEINYNLTQIHSWSTPVRSSSRLRAIGLPQTRDSWNRVHVFALSVTPSLLSPDHDADKPQLVVRRVRFTVQRTTNPDFIVDVSLANLLPEGDDGWLVGTHTLHVVSPLVDTVTPGVVRRLMSGDAVQVDVVVRPKNNVLPGATGTASVELRDADGNVVAFSKGWPAKVPDDKWEANEQSLSQHEAPNWWSDAKFGIFIHWGVYSVPAWAPPGIYAEWYFWHMHNPPDDRNSFWVHQRDTYGTERVYDDFIPEFTASKFNASAWVELFEEAGAKYFVLTTKHHDGVALFNTGETSHRSAYHLGPKRDLLKELLHAAKTERPNLRRGTYFTMPEWFNPDAGPYGFGPWPGHLARHPFHPDEFEPYTGRLPVDDYLEDVQLAQMRILAQQYETEIMWCDIGGPNLTLTFASEWYNQALREGREVAMNNRCGYVPDFDTPEYARFSSVQLHHWETSEGIDPYSYGLNRDTKPEAYRSAETIIHSLVDITSKNGNYLLNIGPTGEGEIIAPMVERLLEVGRWLKHSGDCVYGTRYWSRGAQAGPWVRFTTTPSTFCAVVLQKPEDGLVTIERVLPIRPGDEIQLLGATPHDGGLKWWVEDEKTYIKVHQTDVDLVKHAWAFRVTYADAL